MWHHLCCASPSVNDHKNNPDWWIENHLKRKKEGNSKPIVIFSTGSHNQTHTYTQTAWKLKRASSYYWFFYWSTSSRFPQKWSNCRRGLLTFAAGPKFDPGLPLIGSEGGGGRNTAVERLTSTESWVKFIEQKTKLHIRPWMTVIIIANSSFADVRDEDVISISSLFCESSLRTRFNGLKWWILT